MTCHWVPILWDSSAVKSRLAIWELDWSWSRRFAEASSDEYRLECREYLQREEKKKLIFCVIITQGLAPSDTRLSGWSASLKTPAALRYIKRKEICASELLRAAEPFFETFNHGMRSWNTLSNLEINLIELEMLVRLRQFNEFITTFQQFYRLNHRALMLYAQLEDLFAEVNLLNYSVHTILAHEPSGFVGR